MKTMSGGGSNPIRAVTTAACLYYFSLLPLLGVGLSVAVIPRKPHPNLNAPGFLQSLANWDGVWYERILNEGYFYDPARHSSIAFFPGFPLLAAAVQTVTGLGAVPALLTVSQLSYFLLFLLVPLYMHDRDESGEWASHVAMALMFWPMTLFFRVAYTESLFVLVTILVLMGNRQRWPLLWVAVLAGFGTGVRSVGVVLTTLVMYRAVCEVNSFSKRLINIVWYGLIGTWGLLGFMVFQQCAFGDALVFCKTQAHWATVPDHPHWRQLLGLVILEPVWSVYVLSHPAHWADYEWMPNAITGLQFWNPLIFLVAIGLTVSGVVRRWLTTDELIVCVGLLLIPYILQGHRMAMMGHGRFAGAVFPCYVVMGRLLMDMPPVVRATVIGVGASVTTLLLALFAAWYRVF
jgi:hypothetical protein